MTLPIAKRPIVPPDECQRCGAALGGTYCASCGEKRPDATDYSLGALAREAFHQFAEVDGAIFRTVRALFTQPGLLTAEYFAGRRGLYTRPLALFVTLNLLFFVIQPHTGLMHWNLSEYGDPGRWNAHVVSPDIANTRRALLAKIGETNEPIATFRARFDAAIQDRKKSMLIVSVPLFALALQLVLWAKRRYFVEHLVFSIHCYAFFLAYLGVGLIALLTLLELLAAPLHLGRLLVLLDNTQIGLTLMILGGTAAYLYAALRRFYRLSPWTAAPAALLLALAQQLLLIVFRTLVFWATLWSM